MNFQQAKEKLGKLAKGKYHSVQYQVTETRNNNLSQGCSVYIDGLSWHTEETWKLAFKKLELELNLPSAKPVKIESIEEIKKEV